MSANPWNLTERQIEVLSQMGALGSQRLVAQKLKISDTAVQAHMANIKDAMGARHVITACVVWAKWSEGDDTVRLDPIPEVRVAQMALEIIMANPEWEVLCNANFISQVAPFAGQLARAIEAEHQRKKE